MTSGATGARATALGTGDVAYLLGLEALALRVIPALNERGVDVLILKGPVTNRWLWGGAAARRFSDIDLLIPRHQRDAADALLADLGFRDDHARVLGVHRPDYEASWRPSSGVGSIDLHTRIAGIPADRADQAWRRLRADAADFRLHGHVIGTLDETARTMLLALHAARSRGDSRAQNDLDRGLAVLPETLWRAAADLALEFGADACFSLGLRRSPEGRALARSLDFPESVSVESLLLEREAPQEAFVIAAQLSAGRGSVARNVPGWFRTRTPEPAPLRTRLAAMVRVPGALFMVLRVRHRLRRARRRSSS